MQKYYANILNHIHVRRRPGYQSKGLLRVGGRVLHCALGRSGIGIKRGEGDGITPIGNFRLLSLMARTDKMPLRSSNFDWQIIAPNDGWCDAAGDRNYNRPVPTSYPASHESLTRADHLYDIFIVMDHNVSNHMGVGGSAIFFHLAHDDYRPTEGCVAISPADMAWLLPRIGPQTIMIIE